MTSKIKMCQYVIFIEPRKFDAADIKSVLQQQDGFGFFLWNGNSYRELIQLVYLFRVLLEKKHLGQVVQSQSCYSQGKISGK